MNDQNKLTPEKISDMVDFVEYIYAPSAPTLTVCVLTLRNGAVVTGTSNVIDPANYDEELGRMAAYGNAKSKIWELEGYALKRAMAS